MDLTDLGSAKKALGIALADTSEDDLIAQLIPQVSAVIETWLGRTIGQATYTEFYCGNGRAFLALRQRPVTAIASLYLDELAYWGDAPGAFGSPTLQTEGVDFALDRDQPDGSSKSALLYRINGVWPRLVAWSSGVISAGWQRVGNLKITYTAGYAAIPADIQLAANLLVAKARQSSPYGQALKAENYENYSYQLADAMPVSGGVLGSTGFLPREVAALLASYLNLPVG